MASQYFNVLKSVPLGWKAIDFRIRAEVPCAKLKLMVFAKYLSFANIGDDTPDAFLLLLFINHFA